MLESNKPKGRKRWKPSYGEVWLGHVLSARKICIHMRKRKGAPKISMKENGNGRHEECWSWLGDRLKTSAKDRLIWRDLVEALCATGHSGIE